MKNIFITGADGFIGSHLTEALVRKGYNVKALVHYNAMGREGWLDHIDPAIRQNLQVIAGDIRDPAFIRQEVKNMDGIFHLAALPGIPYSYVNPESYVDTNTKGTLNILEAARAHNVQKIINTSTSEVYGTARFVPITEEHPLQGQSPYSASKIAADQMAYAYYCSFNLPVFTLRPFNTFGPRQSLRAVIPTVIMQLLASDLVKIGATHPTRDFSHVEDTVSGFITAFEYKKQDLFGKTINLGSNFEISIEDMIHLVAGLTGRKAKVEVNQDRLRPQNSEVERLYADNTKAKQLMNWEPRYTGRAGFEKALEKTIAWYKDPENIKLYKMKGYSI